MVAAEGHAPNKVLVGNEERDNSWEVAFEMNFDTITIITMALKKCPNFFSRV